MFFFSKVSGHYLVFRPLILLLFVVSIFRAAKFTSFINSIGTTLVHWFSCCYFWVNQSIPRSLKLSSVLPFTPQTDEPHQKYLPPFISAHPPPTSKLRGGSYPILLLYAHQSSTEMKHWSLIAKQNCFTFNCCTSINFLTSFQMLSFYLNVLLRYSAKSQLFSCAFFCCAVTFSHLL